MRCLNIQVLDSSLFFCIYFLNTTQMHIFLAKSDSCRTTEKGIEYTGTISSTHTGRACQAWSAQSPHTHTFNKPYLFLDVTLANAQNYCRNPGGDRQHPWCFTTDPYQTWDYCDVPWCSSCEWTYFTHFMDDGLSPPPNKKITQDRVCMNIHSA